MMTNAAPNLRVEHAVFAGGCFWCMVKPFDELPGIVSIEAGYTGGHTTDPTYQTVGSETTGHYEAVRIAFQPDIFPYARLLDIYWQLIDPTDDGGQFMDRGHSYRTAIFTQGEEQRLQAEASKRALGKSGRFKKRIVTEILPASAFYPAEEEHQDYYKSHRKNYNLYYDGSGRETFWLRNWRGERDLDRLRSQLTERQFSATQLGEIMPDEDRGNRARDGAGCTDQAGIYVDLLTGDALFGSEDLLDDGLGSASRSPSASAAASASAGLTGWLDFANVLQAGMIRKEAALGGGQARTILRSRLSHAHLGILLRDEPGDSLPGKLRYRINADALRFVPVERMEAEGYGRFLAGIPAPREHGTDRRARE